MEIYFCDTSNKEMKLNISLFPADKEERFQTQ